MRAHSERLRKPQQRAERATRILDAAAELLLRHGYRRVTIDDVAAAAGVGKGTVYLHWKTREQLFSAALVREVCQGVDELRQALQEEPRACLLHEFARSYFQAIVNRPLLRTFLLDDSDLLGKLTSTPHTARDDGHTRTMLGYFQLLAEHGLLRDDLSVDEVSYAYQATFEGFLRTEGVSTVDDAQRADLLARTVQRAFTSDKPASDAALRDVAAGTVTLLGDLIDAERAEFGIPQP